MNEQFFDEAMSRQQEKLAATPDMVAQRRILLDVLDLKQGERVIDVGYGNGIFARELQEAVGASGHVCGVDSAEPMIAMASAICPTGEFLHGDATVLPVGDISFDVATASQLLCFIPDVNRVLQEMFRVLEPGGRLVILDSDWGSLVWNCRNQGLMDRAITMLTGPYANAHVPRTLSRQLISAGFEITDRRSFTVLNWTLDPDSYAQQTVGFIKSMMAASAEFTDTDWSTWEADQLAINKAEEYLFSLNRYVFSATKP